MLLEIPEKSLNLTQSCLYEKVSEYDQDKPQSHTADETIAPEGRTTEHPQQQDICKTTKAKQQSFSSSSR